MKALKDKNKLILIISALMLVASVVIAIFAATSTAAKQKELMSNALTQTEPTEPLVTEAPKPTYSVGKYRVATSNGDSLTLRLEPNTTSDRIIYISSGEELQIIAFWQDWGYTVYGNTGGWVSLNYLELVTASTTAQTTATTDTTAISQ